ncbi:MAG: B12-binding domain-containing protein [Roseobacter sp.]
MSMDQRPDNQRDLERNRPERIGALATEVLTVLRDRQGVTVGGARPFVSEHLYRAILTKGHFDAGGLLAQLRGHRVTLDTIVDLYIPQAAGRLGTDWVDDGLTFADVTIGALRLQALLGETTMQVRMDSFHHNAHMVAMVIVPRGEQHFLGAQVVAAQLRRLGCEVVMSYDESLGMLGARLMAENPDLLLITCCSEETVKSVSQTVQAVRKALHNPPPIFLGGGMVNDKKNLIERTGVDKLSNSAVEAVTYVTEQRSSALSP